MPDMTPAEIVQELNRLHRRNSELGKMLEQLVYGSPVGTLLSWEHGPRKCSLLRVPGSKFDAHAKCWQRAVSDPGITHISCHEVLTQLEYGADSLTLTVPTAPPTAADTRTTRGEEQHDA